MHLISDPSTPAAPNIDFAQFMAVDIRIGRIISATPLIEAHTPAFVLDIDFGAQIGVKKARRRLLSIMNVQICPDGSSPPSSISRRDKSAR